MCIYIYILDIIYHVYPLSSIQVAIEIFAGLGKAPPVQQSQQVQQVQQVQARWSHHPAVWVTVSHGEYEYDIPLGRTSG